MIIKLPEKDKTISIPIFKIYLSDNEDFNDAVELKGLFDTGADISLIEHTLTVGFDLVLDVNVRKTTLPMNRLRYVEYGSI